MGIELIFFGEFSLNFRHMKHRGCAFKGNKGYTKMDSSGFSMNLLVALSDVQVYGLIGWSSSVDNNVVRLFVTYLLSFRNQTPSIINSLFALVCDNASEHVWDRMAKFLKSSDVSIFLIAPYFKFEYFRNNSSVELKEI